MSACEKLELAIDFFLTKGVNEAMKSGGVSWPSRYKQAIMVAFMRNDQGEHAKVLRDALEDLNFSLNTIWLE